MSYGGYVYSSFAATQSIVVDFWFSSSQFMYFGSSPISPILQLLNGTTPLIAIVPGSGGDLHLYHYSGTSGTEIVAGSAFLSSSTWYNLRLEAGLTDGGTATVKIDGVTDINAAVGNYANGTAGATKIMLGTCPFTDTDYDELSVTAAGSSGSALTFLRRNPGGFKKLGL